MILAELMHPWLWLLVVVAVVLAGLIAWRSRRLLRVRREFDHLLAAVRDEPLNQCLHTRFLRRFSDEPLRRRLPFDEAYRAALEILSAHPSSLDARVFALAIGKLHFGRDNPDGLPTPQQEAALIADVSKRSK